MKSNNYWRYVAIPVAILLSVNTQAKPQPDMVLVPAGDFLMGSELEDGNNRAREFGSGKPFYLDEQPQHRQRLPAYYIDRYEVSNLQYSQYILSQGIKGPAYWTDEGFVFSFEPDILKAAPETILRKLAVGVLKLDMDTRKLSREQLLQAIQEHYREYARLPVTHVTWQNAHDYCQWAGKRLPSEAEWEKAARGTDGREFPWGNNFDSQITNTGDDDKWEEGYAPVGSYPNNQSPYGALDMGGNVFEWTASSYLPYPGSDYQAKAYSEDLKVIRGGGGGIGHYALSYFFRTATRQFADPRMASEDVGFRCVKD